MIGMIRVKVPLQLVMEWEWLEERFERAVDRTAIVYDGGEEEDGLEVFDFHNATAEQVESLVRTVLGSRRSSRLGISWVTPEVLQLSDGRRDWLLPLNISFGDWYERAVKRYCQRLSGDGQWIDWWAKSAPRSALWFHRLLRFDPDSGKENRWVFTDDGHTDILLVYAPILDDWAPGDPVPSIAAARSSAAAGVQEVLQRTCEHFRITGLPPQ